MRRVCAHARAGEALCTPRRCALVIVRMRGGQGFFFSRGGNVCGRASVVAILGIPRNGDDDDAGDTNGNKKTSYPKSCSVCVAKYRRGRDHIKK